MKRNWAPYIFLLFLVLILVFVGGLRYGQSVEKTNKVVDYLLSITPSPTHKPEPTPAITFETFAHAGCGLTLMIPKSTTIVENASGSATLGTTPDTILFDCQKKPSAISQIETGKASSSALLYKGQTVSNLHFTTGMNVFTLKNPFTAKNIVFAVSDTYLSLVINTLQFIK